MGIIKRNILFVDDDQSTRLLLQAMLKQAGYLPITSPSAFEALDLVHKHAFDLIILDIMMPEMNGFEFLKRIKSSEKVKNIPVVMLSSKDDKNTIQKALSLGASDYIVKPPQKEIVCKKLENILGGHPRFAEVEFEDPENPDSLVEILHTARVISIGESGLVIKSPIPILKIDDQDIEIPIFRKLGIKSPKMNVVSSVEDEKGDHTVYFTYFGMSDSDVEKIRNWVISQSFKN